MVKIKRKKLYPPATIGVVGGGQLGKMFAFDAKRMGYNVVILDPKVNSPAGQVSDQQIVAGFDEVWAYRELAQKTDVITYEFEHISAKILSLIESEGYEVIPSSKTLEVIQNKFIQKTMLKQIGVKVPEFKMINCIEDLKVEFRGFGQRAILKSCTNGYDGKGNLIIKNPVDLETAYKTFDGQQIFIEELVDFIKEVSIVVVKNDLGVFTYPVVENVHQNSILIKTSVPASISDQVNEKIQEVSKQIVEELDDFGVYCIEFFIDKNSEVLVNEIAPRPHNSGHYTIEGCVTSQFEQLVRVVCKMPIGSTRLRKPCVMYNILGNQYVEGEYEVSGIDDALDTPDCHLHLYGKPETKNLKKIGHLTVLGKTVDLADKKAMCAFKNISIKQKHKKE